MTKLSVGCALALAWAFTAACIEPTTAGADAAVLPDASPGCPGTWTLFLNRLGGRFAPGDVDDPVRNVTALIGQEAVLAPFATGDANWDAVTACVRDLVAPYDIDVVDADPGNVPQLEIVFTSDRARVAGFSTDIASVGAVDCSGSPAPHIAFAFTQAESARTLCERAARLLGESAGLDQTRERGDVMSLFPTSEERAFLDRDAGCDGGDGAACRCDDQTTQQNAHRILLTKFGPRDCAAR